jgi:hypothetical protein
MVLVEVNLIKIFAEETLSLTVVSLLKKEMLAGLTIPEVMSETDDTATV